MSIAANARNKRSPDISFEELRQHFLGQGLPDIARPIVLFNKMAVEQGHHDIPPEILSAVDEPAGQIVERRAKVGHLRG
jgi:hypothetical protein